MSSSHRIRISVDLTLEGSAKEFDISNVLTKVCMECEFSSVRVMKSQL